MHTKACWAGEVKAGGGGELEACFSRFDTVDHDGDVTLKSAFTDGQPVPLCWAHDWKRIVGKGVVRVHPDRAVFEGRFFVNTMAGQEAYATVKEMGELAEYSYGYTPVEAKAGTFRGQSVRFLHKVAVHEVSAVMLGAGIGTGTERLKAGGRAGDDELARIFRANEARLAGLARHRSGTDLDRIDADLQATYRRVMATTGGRR